MKFIKTSPVNVPKTLGAALIAAILALPQILLFEAGYNLFGHFIFRPVFSLITQSLLTISGFNLAFNENIGAAFLNLPGVLGALLLLLAAGLLIYYEFAVVTLLICRRLQKRPVSLVVAMKLAIPTMKALASPGILGFSVYAALLLPVTNLVLLPSLTGVLKIPNFVTGELYKTLPGMLQVTLLWLILVLLYHLTLYVLPSMVLGHFRFGASLRKSFSLLKGGGLVPLIPLWLLMLLWRILFVTPGLIPTEYLGVSDVGTLAVIRELFSSETFVPLVLLLAARILQLWMTAVFLAYLIGFYAGAAGQIAFEEDALPAIDRYLRRTKSQAGSLLARGALYSSLLWRRFRAHPFYKRHKKKLALAAGILVVIALVGFFRTPPQLHAPIAIGHRGSTAGVENTLAAIQGAIDSGADYAEIDIQLSKDGVPVVCHDVNLKRLSGENINIYDLTAQELSALTLSQNGYTGEISTLKEVLDYCDGKIKLAIEFKPHGHEQADLVEATMALLEEKHYEKKCMLLSLDYDLISQAKQSYSQYTVGYCVYGNLGSIDTRKLNQLGVDFLFVEEGMVSSKFVEECRRAWLPVYVWTVNDTKAMDSDLKAGVLGIVSDHPWDAVASVKAYGGGDASKQDFTEENQYSFPEEQGEAN
ncbi:MAG: glycerophosphodiester phosphodiesterase family protein [Eubacterium sp.]|nr:glycerophosphodiester phosphodiesterase family protein [Eubacterium sp.]